MAVTPYNIIQGPGTLYVAAYGTDLSPYIGTNPTTTAVTGDFTDIGGTTGGITVEVDETLSNIQVDQILDPVGARATARTIQVTTTMMETQLSNLVLAMNNSGATLTYPTTDTQQLDLVTTTSATQPQYCSIIVDGWAPTLTAGTAAKRRFIVQKALSSPKISQKFDMANQATVAVTFTAFYTGSTSTSPLTIMDEVNPTV